MAEQESDENRGRRVVGLGPIAEVQGKFWMGGGELFLQKPNETEKAWTETAAMFVRVRGFKGLHSKWTQ